MDQKTALDVLKLGHNVYLTGPAGSGKTFLLNKYIKYLRSKGIQPAITASTGIAATHMDGVTVHSWSGIGIREKFSDKDFIRLAKNLQFRRRLASAKVLIIDEISMLHAFQLDLVDQICRRFKDGSKPFGGLQVILCGDFFQLPPVSKDNQKRALFAFESNAWNEMDIKVCYLSEQHRQKDGEMIEILNAIRSNTVCEKTWELLEGCTGEALPEKIKPTRLHTHNRDVDIINNNELNLIKNKAYRYVMKGEGNEKLVEGLMAGCLSPRELILKKGAQVMFVKNNFEKGFANGTTGIVDGFDAETGFPVVKIKNGKKIVAEPETWVVESEEGKIIASIKQIPLRLAWAITVHKSQGMSLDFAEVDLSKSFEYGMGYVALSRVRSMGGLRLNGINENALEIHPEILKLDKQLQKISSSFWTEMKELHLVRKWLRQKMWIASISPRSSENRKKVSAGNEESFAKIREEYAQAYMPWKKEDDDALKAYVWQGKSAKEIAVMMQRKSGAIHSRIKKLGL